MQCLQQVAEAGGRGFVASDDRPGILQGPKPIGHFRSQAARLGKVSAAEAQPHHGMAHRPVPVAVNGEPLEQRLVALEQLLQSIQEQALPETTRAREEVVLAAVEQPPDEGSLVDVVAAFLTNLAEGLDADGESAPDHGCMILRRKAGYGGPPGMPAVEFDTTMVALCARRHAAVPSRIVPAHTRSSRFVSTRIRMPTRSHVMSPASVRGLPGRKTGVEPISLSAGGCCRNLKPALTGGSGNEQRGSTRGPP